MSTFEFLVTLYAIVAGLGVSLLVRSIGQMIEARDRIRLYWVHTTWLGLVFVAHVFSWFSLWSYADHERWTVLEALLLLGPPILLYLISHLAVPELEDGTVHDLRNYYYRHARWTQALLLAVLVANVAAQRLIDDGSHLAEGRGVRIAMALILLPGIASMRPALHGCQAVLLACAMVYAISFISAPIG
jgi:hypothetical protein